MQLKHVWTLKKIAIGMIGLLGAGFIFLLISIYNSGLTPDSVAYISVARNLANGLGFIKYNGNYFMLQPPLYPLLLAGIEKVFSIDPLVSAGYLNAVFYGLIVFLSGMFLLKYLKSFTLVLLGTISVLISFALVQASFMALSELMFILLVLIFLYFIDIYQSKQSFASLIICSIAVTFACLTRYTGVILILTGIISILLFARSDIKEKIWHSIIFSFISIIPLSIWIVRNYILSGTLFGLRASSSMSLFENIEIFNNIVISWFLPLNLAGIFISLIFLTVTILFFLELYRSRTLKINSIKLLVPTLLFLLAYSGLIIVSSTTTAYDNISNRLLSPIYVPIIFILFFHFDKILNWITKSYHPKYFKLLYITGILLLMTFPVRSTIHHIDDYTKLAGWGYSSNYWQKSETIAYLKANTSLDNKYSFYSNEPSAVYILTNIKSLCSPAKTYYNSTQQFIGNTIEKNSWEKSEKVCLVWFNKSNRKYLFSINELQKANKMKKLAHFKDGSIYTFLVEN